MRAKLVLFLLLAGLAFGTPTFLFTLSPAVETAIGDGVTASIFSGTLQDLANDGNFLFLNDIAVTFDPPGDGFLSIDPTGQSPSSPNTFFFNNVPGSLFGDTDPVDNSYTGPIFEVFAAPGTPLGVYTGTINILGGANQFTDLTVLNDTPIRFQVNVTPEPAAWALMLAGFAVMASIARKR